MMQSSRTSAARLLAIAGLINGVLGVILQYVLFQPLFARMGLGWISSAGFMLVFFTVLTNLMVVAVYWSSLAGARSRLARFFAADGARTAVTAYILLVGIIYATMLYGQLPLTPAQQVPDAMLHFIAPPLCLAWWWLSRPAGPLSFSRIPRWMIWPVSYLAANLIFSALTGAFIYPILDPGQLGWPAVIVVATGMIALLAGLMAALVMVTRRAPAPS